MKLLKITIVFMLMSLTAAAHQPTTSTTMFSKTENGTWVLQVNSSLTAFESEIHYHYGKDSYKTAQEFEELVIKYLKKHIVVLANNKIVINLNQAYVKLGHETNVVFEIDAIPTPLTSMTVTNNSFKDINRSKSAFIILMDGYEKDHFVLEKDNNFTASIINTGSKFELKEVSEKRNRNVIIYSLLAISLMILVSLFTYFYFKNKK
ncbi:hypothetical protein [Nonlabens sp. Asnod2-A12]|uniref:hypothetical protein n=1 Tax=Nonlabens sp. Asnod2-A12 TaxID=3160578 RepID=UPI00386A65CC